ncbi:tetratricopeptide repeat protein, partial [Bifidobacterium animalis]|nr:tetratricopeptide repeat protein [Bifidobacterium animalis]
MAYCTAGDPARAVDAIRQALKLAVVPGEVAFLYCLLGQMFAIAGETDTAIAAYYVASPVAAQTA